MAARAGVRSPARGAAGHAPVGVPGAVGTAARETAVVALEAVEVVAGDVMDAAVVGMAVVLAA